MKNLVLVSVMFLALNSCQKSDNTGGGAAPAALSAQNASIVLSSIGAVSQVADSSRSGQKGNYPSKNIFAAVIERSLSNGKNENLVQKQSDELQKLIDQKRCLISNTEAPKAQSSSDLYIEAVKSFRVQINGAQCPVTIVMSATGNVDESGPIDMALEFSYKALTDEYRAKMDVSEFLFRGSIKGTLSMNQTTKIFLSDMDAQMSGQGLSATQGIFSLSYNEKVHFKLDMGSLSQNPVQSPPTATPSQPSRDNELVLTLSLAFNSNAGQLKLEADINSLTNTSNFTMNGQKIKQQEFLEALAGIKIPGLMSFESIPPASQSQTSQPTSRPSNQSGGISEPVTVARIYPLSDSAGVHLGMDYNYDSEQELAWSLLMTTQFSQSDYQLWPQTMYWRMINSRTGQIYKNWTAMDKSNLMVMSLSLSGQILTQVLPALKESQIVISQDGSLPLYVIDLGEFCNRFPQNILDLTNSSNAKCTIYPYQLPHNMVEP